MKKLELVSGFFILLDLRLEIEAASNTDVGASRTNGVDCFIPFAYKPGCACKHNRALQGRFPPPPDALIERYGYAPLTRPVKEQIFGLKAARVFRADANAKRNEIPRDYLSQIKMTYLEEGPAPPRATAGTAGSPDARAKPAARAHAVAAYGTPYWARTCCSLNFLGGMNSASFHPTLVQLIAQCSAVLDDSPAQR